LGGRDSVRPPSLNQSSRNLDKRLSHSVLACASCFVQTGHSQPAQSNVGAAEFPRIHAGLRVTARSGRRNRNPRASPAASLPSLLKPGVQQIDLPLTQAQLPECGGGICSVGFRPAFDPGRTHEKERPDCGPSGSLGAVVSWMRLRNLKSPSAARASSNEQRKTPWIVRTPSACKPCSVSTGPRFTSASQTCCSCSGDTSQVYNPPEVHPSSVTFCGRCTAD
jgi:hypothetical protein